MAMTKEQEALFAKLSKLQQRIVTGVIEGKTQRQAYIDAGGKARNVDVAASEALSLPKVKEFMTAIAVPAANSAIMTRDEALAMLTGMARTNLTDLVEVVTKRGVGRSKKTVQQVILREEALLDTSKRVAISELIQTAEGLRIKTHSPAQAIQQLSRMQGWDAAQKHDLTGHVLTTEVPLTDAQRALLDRALEEDV